MWLSRRRATMKIFSVFALVFGWFGFYLLNNTRARWRLKCKQNVGTWKNVTHTRSYRLPDKIHFYGNLAKDSVSIPCLHSMKSVRIWFFHKISEFNTFNLNINNKMLMKLNELMIQCQERVTLSLAFNCMWDSTFR